MIHTLTDVAGIHFNNVKGYLYIQILFSLLFFFIIFFFIFFTIQTGKQIFNFLIAMALHHCKQLGGMIEIVYNRFGRVCIPCSFTSSTVSWSHSVHTHLALWCRQTKTWEASSLEYSPQLHPSNPTSIVNCTTHKKGHKILLNTR